MGDAPNFIFYIYTMFIIILVLWVLKALLSTCRNIRRRNEEMISSVNRNININNSNIIVIETSENIEPRVINVFDYVNIDTITQTGTFDSDQKIECVICLEDMERGQIIRTLSCFHIYHKDCVDIWFNRSSKCPICCRDILEQLV